MKIVEYLRKAIMALCITIFGTLVALVIIQVFMRYIVGHALMWGDELMRVLMVWGVMLAGGVAFYYRRHLALDYLLNAMPKKAQKILRTVIWVLIFGISIFYVYQGFKLASQNWVQKLPTLHFSMFYLQMSLPVSAILWLIFGINDLYFVHTDQEPKPLHPPGEEELKLEEGESV